MTNIQINTEVLNDIIAMLSWLDQTPECAKMSVIDRLWEQVYEMWNVESDVEVDEFEMVDGKLVVLIDGKDVPVVGK